RVGLPQRRDLRRKFVGERHSHGGSSGHPIGRSRTLVEFDCNSLWRSYLQSDFIDQLMCCFHSALPFLALPRTSAAWRPRIICESPPRFPGYVPWSAPLSRRGPRPCVISGRGYRFTSGQSHRNLAVSVLDAEMTVRMPAFELLLPPSRFSARRVCAF